MASEDLNTILVSTILAQIELFKAVINSCLNGIKILLAMIDIQYVTENKA